MVDSDKNFKLRRKGRPALKCKTYIIRVHKTYLTRRITLIISADGAECYEDDIH